MDGTLRAAGGARAGGDDLLGQGPLNQLGQLQEIASGHSGNTRDALSPPLHSSDVAGGRARGETKDIVAEATAVSRRRSSPASTCSTASAGLQPREAGCRLRAAGGSGARPPGRGRRILARGSARA